MNSAAIEVPTPDRAVAGDATLAAGRGAGQQDDVSLGHHRQLTARDDGALRADLISPPGSSRAEETRYGGFLNVRRVASPQTFSDKRQYQRIERHTLSFSLAVSCMCIERGSRARTLPDADAGVKSSTVKAGAGTSCPISTIALTVAIKASRPSAIASSSVSPSATIPGMSGMVNMKPPPSAELMGLTTWL